MPDSVRERLQALVGSTYRVENEIGRGGMAVVFRAHDAKHDRAVAIKVMLPELAQSISAQRFLREIRLVAPLQHPNILPLHDSGAGNDLLYFVMPFVEGESLRARLARGPLATDDAVRIAREIADALGYAHERGVVHRDVKPENILLTGEHALLADFGVARAIVPNEPMRGTDVATGSVSVTTTGIVVGTPAYMSPEQALAEGTPDARTDVYALGCVLYEMLAGKPPFTGTAAVAIARRFQGPAPSVRVARPAVPPALDRAIQRALALNPDDRFADGREMMLALSDRSLDVPREPDTGAPSRPRWRMVAVAAGLGVVLVGGAALAFHRSRVGPSGASAIDTSRRHAIAVVPFVNESGNSDDEYFSDGMADELISRLAEVAGLRVAARTSSFAFKGRGQTAQEIASKLDVGAVLEGSVQRAGERLRVMARLVDGTTGTVIWSETLDRTTRDVFAIQDEVTNRIVSKLSLTLAGDATSSRRRRENLAAYDLYLRGRYFWNTRRDATELDRAIAYFQQALAIDSGYARAYAGLADSYSLLTIFGGRRPTEEFPLAKRAVVRALALDSTLAEAHTSLAIVHLFYDRDYGSAEHEFQRAIALDSSYSSARLFHAWNLLALGSTDAALQEMRAAQRLDPLSLLINARLGTLLLLIRRYSAADSQLVATLSLDSTYVVTRAVLGRVYAVEGRTADAIRVHPPLPAMASNYEGGGLGFVYASAGRKRDALQVAVQLETLSRTEYVAPEAVAAVYAAVGDADRAMTWLDRALDERSATLFFVSYEPMYDRLRRDPRFLRLLDRIGVHQIVR